MGRAFPQKQAGALDGVSFVQRRSHISLASSTCSGQGCCHLRQALPMGQCPGPSTGPPSAFVNPQLPCSGHNLRDDLSFEKRKQIALVGGGSCSADAWGGLSPLSVIPAHRQSFINRLENFSPSSP